MRNDRWLGLIVQVPTQSCGHSKKKQSIRVATIVSKMTGDQAQQHNSTTAQAKKDQKIIMYNLSAIFAVTGLTSYSYVEIMPVPKLKAR